MRAAVGERVLHERHGAGVVTSHASREAMFVRFDGRAGSVMCSNVSLRPVEHKPVDDDGVKYCGWTTEAGTFGGCGHAWPCPTRQHDSALT